MTMLGVFILGILSGWGMEWLIVRFFIPNPCRKADATLQACRKENESLRRTASEVKAAEVKVAEVKVAEVKVASLQTPPAPTVAAEDVAAEPTVTEDVPAPVVEVALVVADEALVADDDFSKLAGIGPKLAETMKAANISTYAQLAVMSLDELTGRLSGIRFSKTVAETWPIQAGFAERGDWEGLKAYQASLKA